MLKLIVAMDEGRGIGVNNVIPWNIPSEMRHFSRTTRGHAVVMGRRTFESLGTWLPERLNIVMTRRSNAALPGVIVIDELETLKKLNIAKTFPSDKPVDTFIIGGAEIYKLALPCVDAMYITIVKDRYECDTFFPEFNPDDWEYIIVEDNELYIIQYLTRKVPVNFFG